MSKNKNRIRYILCPVLLALATIASCVGLTNHGAEQAKRQTYEVLSDSAAEQISVLNIALRGSYETLNAYAKGIAVQENFLFDSKAALAQLSAANDGSLLYHIYLLDERGNGYSAEGETFLAADREYFKAAMRGENGLEMVKASRLSTEPSFILSVPLVRGDRIIGAVIGTYAEADIRSLMISEAYDRQSYSFVCDPEGTIVIEPLYEQDGLRAFDNILEKISSDEAAARAVNEDLTAGRSGYVPFTINGETRYSFYSPVGSNGWVLFNTVPDSVVREAVANSTESAYVVTIFILLLSLAMLVYIDRMARRSRRKIEAEQEDMRVAAHQSGRFILKYDLPSDTAYCIGDRAWYFGENEKITDFSRMLAKSRRVDAEGIKTIMAAIKKLRAGEPNQDFEVLAMTQTGEEHWVHVDCTLVCSERSKPGRVIVCYYDNSLQHEREQGYMKWKNELNKLFEASVCYMEVNLTTNSVERVSGLEKAQRTAADAEHVYSRYIGFNAERHVAPEDGEDYLRFFERERLLALFATGVSSDKIEFRSLLSGGEQWCRSDVRMTKAPLSEEVKAIAILTNVDDEHREREALRRQAERDSLTGIYNRKAAEDKIRSLLVRQEKGTPGAFFIIDLDNLKVLNDAKGHQAGDAALRGITEAISGILAESGIVGRLGGDELIAYLPDCGGRKAAERTAGEMSYATQFAVEGLPVTTSIGVALSDGEKSFEQLYKEADDALYHAKTSGKNQFCLSNGGCGHAYTETIMADIQTVRLQSLLENMNGSIVVVEVGEMIRVTYTSPSFFRMFGASPEDAAAQGSILSMICDEDYPAVEKAIRDTAETGEPTNCVYRTKGGGDYWRHLHLARLPGNGKTVEVIGMISDISELKRSGKFRGGEARGHTPTTGKN